MIHSGEEQVARQFCPRGITHGAFGFIERPDHADRIVDTARQIRQSPDIRIPPPARLVIEDAEGPDGAPIGRVDRATEVGANPQFRMRRMIAEALILRGVVDLEDRIFCRREPAKRVRQWGMPSVSDGGVSAPDASEQLTVDIFINERDDSDRGVEPFTRHFGEPVERRVVQSLRQQVDQSPVWTQVALAALRGGQATGSIEASISMQIMQ
jgi:hypothetical protein